MSSGKREDSCDTSILLRAHKLRYIIREIVNSTAYLSCPNNIDVTNFTAYLGYSTDIDIVTSTASFDCSTNNDVVNSTASLEYSTHMDVNSIAYVAFSTTILPYMFLLSSSTIRWL